MEHGGGLAALQAPVAPEPSAEGRGQRDLGRRRGVPGTGRAEDGLGGGEFHGRRGREARGEADKELTGGASNSGGTTAVDT